MGRDKALVAVGGTPMVVRVVSALREAGAGEVVVVGGDLPRLEGLGLDVRPDQQPGAGPLGGIVSALAVTSHDPVAVLACDLTAPDPAAVQALLGALDRAPDADAAVSLAGGRRQWLHGAWRRRAGPPLAVAFDAGERAVHRAAAGLVVVDVPAVATAVADADEPADLEPGDPAGGPAGGR